MESKILENHKGTYDPKFIFGLTEGRKHKREIIEKAKLMKTKMTYYLFVLCDNWWISALWIVLLNCFLSSTDIMKYLLTFLLNVLQPKQLSTS